MSKDKSVIRIAYDKKSGKITPSVEIAGLDLATKLYEGNGCISGAPFADIVMFDSNSLYDRPIENRGSQQKEAKFDIDLIDKEVSVVQVNNRECSLHGTPGTMPTIGLPALISLGHKDRRIFICKSVAFAESLSSSFIKMSDEGESLWEKIQYEVDAIRNVQLKESCRAGACKYFAEDQNKNRANWDGVTSMAGVWIESIKSLSLLVHTLSEPKLADVLSSHLRDLKEAGLRPTNVTTLIMASCFDRAKTTKTGRGSSFGHWGKTKNSIESNFKEFNRKIFKSQMESSKSSNIFTDVLFHNNGAINAMFDQSLIQAGIDTLLKVAKTNNSDHCSLALITGDEELTKAVALF